LKSFFGPTGRLRGNLSSLLMVASSSVATACRSAEISECTFTSSSACSQGGRASGGKLAIICLPSTVPTRRRSPVSSFSHTKAFGWGLPHWYLGAVSNVSRCFATDPVPFVTSRKTPTRLRFAVDPVACSDRLCFRGFFSSGTTTPGRSGAFGSTTAGRSGAFGSTTAGRSGFGLRYDAGK